jgi:hypothetical protein
MSGGIHLLEDARDSAVWINDKRRARDPHTLHPEGVFLHPDTVRLADRVILIHQESRGQAVLCLEASVRLSAVGADSEHLCIESLEPRESVSKGARFDGSTRGVVLRIEKQNDPLPFETRKGDTPVGVIERRERGSLVSNCRNGHRIRPGLVISVPAS